MKVQKFTGNSEEDAIKKAKASLGENIVILNTEEIKVKGFFGMSKKSEFTVSVSISEQTSTNVGEDFMEQMLMFAKKDDLKEEIKIEEVKNIEVKKEDSQKKALPRLNEKMPSQASLGSRSEHDEGLRFEYLIEDDLTKELFTHPSLNKDVEQEENFEQNSEQNFKDDELKEKLEIQKNQLREKDERIKELEIELEKVTEASKFEEEKIIFENNVIQTFYEELLLHGVLPSIAKYLLEGSKDETDIGEISSTVYSKIVNILKKPSPIENETDETKFIFFFGPTGVGKTTTIAKIASKLVLDENEDIALITADTYRIAAAEQLKIYADILSVDIDVIYESKEFLNSATKFKNKGKKMVLVDSAGRSHKKDENLKELVEIFDTPFLNDKFLVLSATTKYEDLEDIISKFLSVGEFRLILTKFDETLSYGNVLNICFNLNIEVVYITTGQTVPYDIEVLNPQKIAKALLGLEVYN